MTVDIHVVAFATAADALGGGERDVTLPDGATVADLRRLLEEAHPALVPHWPRLAVAIDGRLVGAEAELPDGCEVALLPPVSGGAPEPPVLVDGPLDVAAATARVTSPRRGAVVTFLGTVRNHHRGRPVERLTYDAYRPMAEEGLRRIAGELEKAGEELAVVIVHRLGDVPAGEASVVIAVGSPHRGAAYEASRVALERLKKEVPIWKKEHYGDGVAEWREEESLVG